MGRNSKYGWSEDGLRRQYGPNQWVSRETWEKKLARGRKRYLENRKRQNSLTKAAYERNKEQRLAWGKEYYQKNKAKIRDRNRLRYAESLSYRLIRNLRRATKKAVHVGWTQRWKTADLIGCSHEELRTHLEKQFKPGMTWENYGFRGWHIDHIKPLANIDIKNDDEVKAALHFTNLQPLWWRENISKGNRC